MTPRPAPPPHRPRKRFGQNFLVNPSLLEKIADLAGLDAQTPVVEIGAGTGNLTRRLARRAARVYALELDRDLAAALRQAPDLAGVEVIEADALRFDFAALAAPGVPLKIVGNLPYNISVPLIFRLLEEIPAVSEMLFMVQREVADRLTATPGGKSYGAVSVLVAMLADAEKVLRVSPGSFRPRPQVESAVVRFRRLPALRCPAADWRFFSRVVKTAFGHRRKTLLNALAAGENAFAPETAAAALADCRLDPRRRAESLSLEEFAALAAALWQRQGP